MFLHIVFVSQIVVSLNCFLIFRLLYVLINFVLCTPVCIYFRAAFWRNIENE